MAKFVSKKELNKILKEQKINFAGTQWEVSFFNPYLHADTTFPLVSINFGKTKGTEVLEIAYSLKFDLGEIANTFYKKVLTQRENENEKIKKLFSKTLANSLRRLGLETNFIKREEIKKVFPDNTQAYFIYDTNTLRNGTFIYFAKYIEKAIHAVPKHVKMELQAQIAEKLPKIKENLKSENIERFFNYYEIANNTLRNLYQAEKIATVETIGPDIFRFLEVKGTKQTRRNIAYDRFIIETARKILEERNLNIPVYIVTSDYNMARFARLERVSVLYVKPPQFPEKEIYAFQYDLAFDRFVFTSIYDLIWEWTNLFTGLVLENDDCKLIFNYYPPRKELFYWEEDLLGFSMEPTIKPVSTEKNEVYAIKRMALDNLLDIIEFFEDKNNMSIHFDEIKALLHKSDEIVRNHLYFLSDIKVLKRKNNEYLQGQQYQTFISAWENKNIHERLKTINEIFLSHPYLDRWFQWLKQEGVIAPAKYPHGFSKRAHEVIISMLKKLGWIYETMNKQITYADVIMQEKKFITAFTESYQQLSQKQGLKLLELAELFDTFIKKYHVAYYHLVKLFENLYKKEKNRLKISSGGMPYKEHWVIYLNDKNAEERWAKVNLYDGIVIGEINIKGLEIVGC